MLHDLGMLQPEPISLQQATADPCLKGDTQTLKGRSVSVSVGPLGPGKHQVLTDPSKHLWWVWGCFLNAI